MIRKRIFTLLTAVFMVLAFSAMAFAANQVILKTTVPNIPKSTCYQAGTDTMEFDNLSKMEEGDVITFTVNNLVTICKGIDYFVTFANTAGVLDTTGAQPVSTTGGSISAAGAGQQWGFVVKGPVGSQVITLTLRQVTTATGVLVAVTPNNMVTFTGAAPAANQKLIVKLFDGKVGVWAASGIQKYNSVTNAYDTAIAATDNALCIDTLTQNYPGEYVGNTPNSAPVAVAQKLNFSFDPYIAHIMAAQTYNLVTCKGATCGNLVLGTGGQSASCVSFDYETIGLGTNGYCTNHTANTGYLPKFILQTSQPFELVPYTVTAQILVNGVAGEHGIYWSSTAPAYKTSANTTCATPVGASLFAGQTYYKADGVTTVAAPVAPGANNCAAVAAASKAVSFTTTAGSLFAAGDLFFELNLPDFVYNLAEVNAGDVVTVRVTLSKATCGVVGSYDLCIGTFIAACPGVSSSSLTLPYFTSLTADPTYWNGVAIVNTGSTAGTALLTAYEQDGSVATFTTPSIAANSMYVGLLENIAWVGSGLGGSPAYIAVTSTCSSLQAFAMIADRATGVSMGYVK